MSVHSGRADIGLLTTISNHCSTGASGFDRGTVRTAHALGQNGPRSPDDGMNIDQSSWMSEPHSPEILPFSFMLQVRDLIYDPNTAS